MQQVIDKVHFLTGNADMLERVYDTPALKTWDERTVDFLALFSQKLMADPRTRSYEDVMSYAFWIRRASLTHIREQYYSDIYGKIGRGVALHIAPSNVPINFAVSFTSSFLAGNINIVRVSNKDFEQVRIIVDALRAAFADGMQDMEKYLIIIRYEHDDDVTSYLSSLCDVRIIWGGDRTIEYIRRASIPPRAIEMTFADRHSIALFNAADVLSGDTERMAYGFYTDTYYTDQNACSSPRMVVWFGLPGDIIAAKEKFWTVVQTFVKDKYGFRPIQAIDKLEQLCLTAAEMDYAHGSMIRIGNDNRVVRIRVDSLNSELMDHKFGGGYFYEYDAKSLDELLPVLGKSCQTIAYYGLDRSKLQEFVLNSGIRGVDRIVPVGKTMDLTFKWDGYDMIQNMSRWVYAPEYTEVIK